MSRRTVAVAAVIVVGLVGVGVWLFAGDRLPQSWPRLARGAERALPAGQSDLVGAAGSRTVQPGTASPALADADSDRRGTGAALDTTLALAGGDVLISYPPGFELAATHEQMLVDSQIPPCDQGFDYCIYLDAEEYAGTNFSSAGLGIVAREDLTNEADCLLTQPDGYLDLAPVVAGATGFATVLYRGVDQGGAGHYSAGSVGRLYFGSVCYQFEARVAKAQFANYPIGTVDEFDDADEERTAERLLEIMAQVTLPDGRSGLWGREADGRSGLWGREAAGSGDGGRETDVALFPEVSQPDAGATVRSPLLLSGEAPGTWYFEASFPYQLISASGEVLASGAATALGDWMTESLVPFEVSIDFDVEERTEAVLHLSKDNPSALPENDAALEVPLLLSP